MDSSAPRHGPGWALLGDAGYHKDPITAQGMTDALLHAELLAAAIVEGMSDGGSLDASLTQYGQRRDEKARPMYGLTCDLARLAPPPPEMAALIGALADDSAGHAGLPRPDGRHGRGRRISSPRPTWRGSPASHWLPSPQI